VSDPATAPVAAPAPARALAPALRFPQLLRALPAYRWWKPLLALLLAFLLWVVFQVLVGGAGVVIELVRGGIRTDTAAHLTKDVTVFLTIDTANPLSIVAGLGGVATLLPAVLLAYRIVGLRPIGVLRSVAFRLRWRWMALCLVPALLITLIATGVSFIGSGPLSAPTVPLGTFLLCAVLIIVLTPIQAAAEEFAFRGLLMQMFGSWIRWAWLVIPLAAVIFAAAHTQYFGWATADVFVFALVAGYVTWRTGGIEAGIALHAANNTVAFLILASSITGGTRNTGGTGDPISLLVSIVTMGLYVVAIEWLARRRGIVNELRPVAAAPEAVLPPAPPPVVGGIGVGE
jgi:membrane protease YdiL (CAAX protease family)